MSKLFDQLKDAAREREGGILLDALARKQRSDAAAQAGTPTQGELSLPEAAAARLPEELPVPAFESPSAATSVSPTSAPSAKADATGASRSPIAGVALAALIFLVAFLAWQAAPWRAPQKVHIEPGSLKLDRKLDLDRSPSKGTTPPSRPS